MSAPTRGGVTVKVLTGRTAASLQRYRDSNDEGQEPYLFSATRHCSHDVETQIAEWKAVRERHGTQGARRTQRARYETVDPETGLHASGRMGTHIMEHRGGRWRKRPVRDGEMSTHLRIEAGDLVVKESEAVHTIYAAGADLVNPDDPQDLERFFEAVKAEREAHYAGVQESMWLERNGKSGLVHVHVASNATLYEAFTVDGVDYTAGRKMAGDLTRVHSVRAGFERYLDEHPEHGFQQSLARVGSQEYQDAQLRSGQRDYHDTRRGGESNHDRIRREVVEAMQVAGVEDRDAFIAEMKARGIDVTESGLRRGIPSKRHDYTYRVDGTTQAVRGCTLGVEYTHAAIGAQLELKALGRELEPPVDKQRSGPAKPLPFEAGDGSPLSVDEQRELKRLRAEVERLAEEERARDRGGQASEPHRGSFADAAQRMQEWYASGQADAEFERLRAERDRAELEETSQPSSSAPAPAEEVGPDAPAVTNDIEPVSYRSRLRELTGRDERAQAVLARLIALDEEYGPGFERGETPDAEFDRRVTEIGVGRRLLDGKLGQRLHPAVRGMLELRETGKAVSRAEFDMARATSSTAAFWVHMARRDRVRALVEGGEYARAAAMSRQRLGEETVPEVATSGPTRPGGDLGR